MTKILHIFLILFVGLLTLSGLACTQVNETMTPTAEQAMPETAYEIRYIVDGGRPPIAATLNISRTGEALLYLGSSWSLPGGTDAIGYFATTLSESQVNELSQQIEAAGILSVSRGTPPASPDATARYLHVSRDGQENEIVLGGQVVAETIMTLESTLTGLMAQLAHEPSRAVQGELSFDQPTRQPTVSLTNVGNEPLTILLFDSATTNDYLRGSWLLESWPDDDSGFATPLTNGQLSRDEVALLVESGAFPDGTVEMAAGEAYQFSLPMLAEVTDSNLHLRVSLTFWLPGPPPQKRQVQMQLGPLPLE